MHLRILTIAASVALTALIMPRASHAQDAAAVCANSDLAQGIEWRTKAGKVYGSRLRQFGSYLCRESGDGFLVATENLLEAHTCSRVFVDCRRSLYDDVRILQDLGPQPGWSGRWANNTLWEVEYPNAGGERDQYVQFH